MASAAPARNVAAARFSRERRATWPASSRAVVNNAGNSQRHGGSSSSRNIQTVSTVATTVNHVAAERMACSGVIRRASMIQWSSSASRRRWMISSASRSSREMMLWLSQASAWLACSLMRAAQQVVVKLGLEPHGFAHQEAAQLQRDQLRAWAIRRIPCEASEANRLQIFRHTDGDFAQKRRRGAHDGFEHLADRVAGERRFAGQHLEHQTAKRKHVRRRAERLPLRLLRRGVKRRALEPAPLPAGFLQAKARGRNPESAAACPGQR